MCTLCWCAHGIPRAHTAIKLEPDDRGQASGGHLNPAGGFQRDFSNKSPSVCDAHSRPHNQRVEVYLDETLVYQAGAVSTIHTNINAGVGSHTVMARAWDTSGAHGDQVVTAKVYPVAVNISTPLDNASVGSPVKIQAAASSANAITGWIVYIDSINAFQQYDGSR